MRTDSVGFVGGAWVVVIGCGLLCAPLAAQPNDDVLRGVRGAELRGLGQWPVADGLVPFNWANGVSADGRVVVGEFGVRGEGAWTGSFRWTEAEGLVPLGVTFGPDGDSAAFAASSDGAAVVGRVQLLDDVGGAQDEAFVSLPSDTVLGLGGFVSNGVNTDGVYPGLIGSALAVSGDGRVVAGAAMEITRRRGDLIIGGLRPAWWVRDAADVWTLRAMPRLDASSGAGQANGISRDGTVIVGSELYDTEGNLRRALVWSEAGGVRSIGGLNSVNLNSVARAISGDGRVVVGHSFSNDGLQEGFRWSAGAGMQPLGTLGDETISVEAKSVNADGSVIGLVTTISIDESTKGLVATVWREGTGLQRLGEVLVRQGVPIGDWKLGEVRGVSADGRVLVGLGVNPGGQFEGFRAVLASPCLADWNGDGFADLGDVQLFVAAYLAQDASADVNGDGVVDTGDAGAFVDTFLAGC